MARKPGFYFSTEKQIEKIKVRQARVRLSEKQFKRIDRLIKNITKRTTFSNVNPEIGRSAYETKLYEITKPTLIKNKFGTVIGRKYDKQTRDRIEKIAKLSKQGKSPTYILRRFFKHTEDYKQLKKQLGYKPRAFEIINPERARARDEWYEENELELHAASVEYRAGKITYGGYLRKTAKAQIELCDKYGIC